LRVAFHYNEHKAKLKFGIKKHFVFVLRGEFGWFKLGKIRIYSEVA
jgi:hypothetical protein